MLTLPITPTDMAERPARERILLTAHDLFYRHGIRAVGIDRVIAEAGVTKVTLYRHFPSKDDLIRAFLALRHERWMAWFRDALARHQASLAALGAPASPWAALVPTLREWFESPLFRGCAFINSVAELGGALPEVLTLAAAHKRDMVDALADLLPAAAPNRLARAQAVALVVDGAIVRAQSGPDGVQEALSGVQCVVDVLA